VKDQELTAVNHEGGEKSGDILRCGSSTGKLDYKALKKNGRSRRAAWGGKGSSGRQYIAFSLCPILQSHKIQEKRTKGSAGILKKNTRCGKVVTKKKSIRRVSSTRDQSFITEQRKTTCGKIKH